MNSIAWESTPFARAQISPLGIENGSREHTHTQHTYRVKEIGDIALDFYVNAAKYLEN